MITERPRAETLLRVVLILIGLAAIGFGCFTLVTRVHPVGWFRLIRWGVAGWVISDLVLIPVAMLLGIVVLRRIPVRYRWPLRGGLLGLASWLIMIVISVGARPFRQNPTVLVTAPEVAALITGGALVMAVLITEAVLLLRARSEPAQRDKGPTVG